MTIWPTPTTDFYLPSYFSPNFLPAPAPPSAAESQGKDRYLDGEDTGIRKNMREREKYKYELVTGLAGKGVWIHSWRQGHAHFGVLQAQLVYPTPRIHGRTGTASRTNSTRSSRNRCTSASGKTAQRAAAPVRGRRGQNGTFCCRGIGPVPRNSCRVRSYAWAGWSWDIGVLHRGHCRCQWRRRKWGRRNPSWGGDGSGSCAVFKMCEIAYGHYYAEWAIIDYRPVRCLLDHR